ncbi:hypothetical protein [Jeotgalibacillus soli]|uniref:Acetyltransferase n=1 Tax=Jeotgalibacillus soli TaxID=889306 RepID=A0A0C2VSZ4_9BACL|nr:hypothetical protein [Jeotgalibacillus soli]KIL52027.1 hypothetical protein KP78_03970 [Jeotgalibacillus soli]
MSYEQNQPHNKYIEGNLIYLRPYETEKDREALYKGMFAKEANLFTGSTKPFSKKMIDQYVDKVMIGDHTRVDLLIIRQEDDAGLGEVVLNEIDQCEYLHWSIS